MPLLSVITPVSSSSILYLDECRQSIRGLWLPPNWQLEWLIQLDGGNTSLERDWFKDQGVFFEANGKQLGAGGTRHLALRRARGGFILPLDADDLLVPDALISLSRGFEADENIVWCAGRWDELYGDGLTKTWRHPEYEGIRPQHWVYKEIERTGQTPFAMNSVLYRTEAVLQAGGWPDIDWQDTILLVIVNSRWPGWATDKLVGYYRRHPGQASKSNWFQDPTRKSKMYEYIKRIGRAQIWRPSDST
ncbi:MAG: glycosyltransferase [Candidatus Colwellbacteria bacterium]|nr:glycosyltransferase [Candidatus Colwellbacteria bacterium]